MGGFSEPRRQALPQVNTMGNIFGGACAEDSNGPAVPDMAGGSTFDVVCLYPQTRPSRGGRGTGEDFVPGGVEVATFVCRDLTGATTMGQLKALAWNGAHANERIKLANDKHSPWLQDDHTLRQLFGIGKDWEIPEQDRKIQFGEIHEEDEWQESWGKKRKN